MTYLERVTECEHGQFVNHPLPGAGVVYSEKDWCIDGSRERITREQFERAIDEAWTACYVRYHLDVDALWSSLGVSDDS